MTGSAAKPVAGENDLAQNPFNLAAERGPSLFDARHRLVFSYQWALPFLRSPTAVTRVALADWQLNGIVTAMSGTPFTVFDSTDVSVQGGAPEITGFSANRPDLVSGQDPNAGPRTTSAWLNAAAFSQVDSRSQLACATIRDRGPQHRPGAQILQLGLFRLQEFPGDGIERNSSSRAEFFNILNHTNFRLPDSDISSPTFNTDPGRARPPRDSVGVEVLVLGERGCLACA